MLACDGLWDQLTYDDVAQVLNDDARDSSLTPAQRLVRAAKEAGSSDNITAVAVRLTVPPDVSGLDPDASTNPDHAAEKSPGGRDRGGKSGKRSDPGKETKRSGESSVGRDMAGSSTETSHLAVSMKRVADTELEVSSDEEKCVADVGGWSATDDELVDSGGSSIDVQRSSSHGSCQNFLRLSKVGSSLEDALMAVAAEAELASHELSPSSSGPSDVLRTTSEDTSGQSPEDPSVEAGAVEMRVASMHKRSKRRSLYSCQQRRGQKENRRPSDDAGETPPCLRGGSPLLRDEDPAGPGRAASSFGESCCRSLSLPSGSGTLLNVHPATQRLPAATARPVVEGRGGGGRISAVAAAPSRWTIAVEVDAEVGMFEEIPGGGGVVVAGPPSSAMNLSSHW